MQAVVECGSAYLHMLCDNIVQHEGEGGESTDDCRHMLQWNMYHENRGDTYMDMEK